MFRKTMEKVGLIGDSLDELVEKELQAPLAQLYFRLRPSSLETKNAILDQMDAYILDSKDKKAVKTQKFDEQETTLLFSIFRIINRRPYTEGDTFSSSKQALQDYASLSDEKRALFRKSIIAIPHKAKTCSFQRQNMRV